MMIPADLDLLRTLCQISALLAVSLIHAAEAPPSIEWQQVLGGTGSDTVRAITPASDGSLFVCGESASDASGNKTSPQHGGGDFWLAKLDTYGNLLWDRSFGGTERESVAVPGVVTDDGSFVLGGMSRSGVSGNKTSPGYGLDDAWLVKVNAEGSKVWEQSYGGSDSEWLWAVLPLSEGGFLAGGYSQSGISGTKESTNQGGSDFWLLKLDAQGNKLWDRSFGGSGDELLTSILPTADGGFLLCGDSSSPVSGNKTSPRYGQADIWLVKIDADGNKLWDKSYGGSDYDIPAGMLRTADGGFVLGGASASPISGNKTSAGFGRDDFWLIKLDSDGNKLWEFTYGSPQREFMMSLAPTSDGGFLLGGQANTAGQPLTPGNRKSPGNGTLQDYWVAKVDGNGRLLWDQIFGGSGTDSFSHLSVAAEGGVLLGGASSSAISGNKTLFGYGGYDFWVLKLAGPPQLSVEPSAGGLRISWPFSAADYLLEQTPALTEAAWFQTSLPSQTDGTRRFITVPSPTDNTFYRLRKP